MCEVDKEDSLIRVQLLDRTGNEEARQALARPAFVADYADGFHILSPFHGMSVQCLSIMLLQQKNGVKAKKASGQECEPSLGKHGGEFERHQGDKPNRAKAKRSASLKDCQTDCFTCWLCGGPVSGGSVKECCGGSARAPGFLMSPGLGNALVNRDDRQARSVAQDA